MIAFRMRLEVFLLLTSSAASSAACDDTEPGVVEVGAIEYAGSPALIEVPTSVKLGESALVRVRTSGNGCVSLEDTEVSMFDGGVEITPYDRRKPPPCTLIQNFFMHEASVNFETLGAKTVLVNGRIVGSTSQLVQKTFTMTVVE